MTAIQHHSHPHQHLQQHQQSPSQGHETQMFTPHPSPSSHHPALIPTGWAPSPTFENQSYFVPAPQDPTGPIEDPFAIQSHHRYAPREGVTGLILSKPQDSSPSSSTSTHTTPSSNLTLPSPLPGQPAEVPHDPIFFDARASGLWPLPLPPPPPPYHFSPPPPPMLHAFTGLGLFVPSFGPCEPEPHASFAPSFPGPAFTPRLVPAFPLRMPLPPLPPHMRMHMPPSMPMLPPMPMPMPMRDVFPYPAPSHMQGRRYSFFSEPSPPLASPSSDDRRRGSLKTPRSHHVPISGKLCSNFLDAFCNNQAAAETISDIKGYIVEFACDQLGSRFLQVKLDHASHDDKQLAFDEIIDAAYQVMTDAFGNYVVQRMFEYGSQAQKAALANAMQGHVFGLSMHAYGCRVVQKALEHVLASQQVLIIAELDGHVVDCVQSSNGNHVIQRMLEQINPACLDFVVKALSDKMYELSTHPYGCRVLQRAFEHLQSEQTTQMVEELNKRAKELILDPFGNYVVQNLIKCGIAEDKRFVIRSLLGELINMARHKHASNVCEQALIFAEPSDRRALIQEMIDPGPDGMSPVGMYMADSYGNYVLQRAIRLADADQKQLLLEAMRPVLSDMRRARYHSIRHLSSIEKLVADMSDMSVTNTPSTGKLIEIELESPSSTSDVLTESEGSDDGWSCVP